MNNNPFINSTIGCNPQSYLLLLYNPKCLRVFMGRAYPYKTNTGLTSDVRDWFNHHSVMHFTFKFMFN